MNHLAYGEKNSAKNIAVRRYRVDSKNMMMMMMMIVVMTISDLGR